MKKKSLSLTKKSSAKWGAIISGKQSGKGGGGGGGGVNPATLTSVEASEIAKDIFTKTAVVAPSFHRHMGYLRATLPPRTKVGIVYVMPSLARWFASEPVSFIPCTSETLRAQGCPEPVCIAFEASNTDLVLYGIVACPFLALGQKDKNALSMHWEAGVYTLDECARLEKEDYIVYPTLIILPARHFCVCAQCGAKEAPEVCLDCKRLRYCSEQCKINHWRVHMVDGCDPKKVMN